MLAVPPRYVQGPPQREDLLALGVVDRVGVTDRDARHELVNQLLEELRIAHLRDAPAPSLSGGERRRVEIARALATRPSFMLLDEPFAGIDPLAITDIRDLIRFLRERGIGILITDHNVRETLEITEDYDYNLDVAYLQKYGRA